MLFYLSIVGSFDYNYHEIEATENDKHIRTQRDLRDGLFTLYFTEEGQAGSIIR